MEFISLGPQAVFRIYALRLCQAEIWIESSILLKSESGLADVVQHFILMPEGRTHRETACVYKFRNMSQRRW
jgi:hypothetical protein